MKISAQHVAQLHAQLERRGYERRYISERSRWNALWNMDPAFVGPWLAVAYEYANDNHIDTALRAYFKD